jgi:hypothetical protein
MENVYVFLPDGHEWEDMIIYLTEEDAIKASLAYRYARVEIFKKQPNGNGYTPTYAYYEKGKLTNAV